jgi:asparagine synthase (glutamine-hydrolysing)
MLAFLCVSCASLWLKIFDMCGIIGFLAKGSSFPDRPRLEKATQSLSHRGPDENGTWCHQRVGLGFRRLSIIDLKKGSQPMSDPAGRYHIVFNGEIYNFKELRSSLEQKGCRFQTQSDTEVLLQLYAAAGEDCVRQLRGMFAFAIYDKDKESLFLARDRFGKKPLIYTETSTGFYFSSEVGALLQLADCAKDVDLVAVQQYLSLNYVPSPRTIWRDIKRLPAASTLKVEWGKAQTPQHYWHLDWKPRAIPEDEAVHRFRSLFEESVRLRLISDVPLGAFLSGGIDSTLTVAAMTQASSRVKTFCVGFEESRFDEAPYAREAANRLGTDHHEIRISAKSLHTLDDLLDSLGEPFADQSILPTYLLSKATRQHVTVALSGDGGDEFFAGYKRYQHLQRSAQIKKFGLAKPWSTLSKASFQIEKILNPRRRKLQWPRSAIDQIVGLPPLDQYLNLVSTWHSEEMGSLLRHSSDDTLDYFRDLSIKFSHLDSLTKWQALDTETYLIDDILRKVDTASMACSLECRCPFLDHHLAEFVATLPSDLKLRGSESKVLLKKVYPDKIPPEFFHRKKKGFSIPLADWMRTEWKNPIAESIQNISPELDKTFDRSILQQMWHEHQEGVNDHSSRLWNWFVLYRWNEKFKPIW